MSGAGEPNPSGTKEEEGSKPQQDVPSPGSVPQATSRGGCHSLLLLSGLAVLDFSPFPHSHALSYLRASVSSPWTTLFSWQTCPQRLGLSSVIH